MALESRMFFTTKIREFGESTVIYMDFSSLALIAQFFLLGVGNCSVSVSCREIVVSETVRLGGESWQV